MKEPNQNTVKQMLFLSFIKRLNAMFLSRKGLDYIINSFMAKAFII